MSCDPYKYFILKSKPRAFQYAINFDSIIIGSRDSLQESLVIFAKTPKKTILEKSK
jgi:hypothetical protein